MRPRLRWLMSMPALLLAAGCTEPRNVGPAPTAPTTTTTTTTEPVAAPPAETVATPAPAPETAATPAPAPKRFEGPILGQTTQDIGKAAPEMAKGTQVANTKITARDPITLPGNAYVTIIGRSSMMQVQHAMDLYKAENEQYPKDYNEFMEKIIRANNIALPRLPSYQDYQYDENEHKLIIIEYPDRKGPR